MHKIPVYDSFKPDKEAAHFESSSSFDNIVEAHYDIMGSSTSAQS